MKYLYILLFVITGTLVSCVEDDTDGVSKVTTYPIITINGPSSIIVNEGASYTDAGAISKEGEDEIETMTDLSNGTYFKAPFSTNAPDLYSVTYSAINKDGFPGSAVKSVVVKPTSGDLVTDLSGLYTMDVLRDNGASGSNLKYAFIIKTGANTYKVSDAIGGYYDIRAAYGSGYAATFTVTANNIAANDFATIAPAFTTGGWIYSFTPKDFKVNAAEKTITFNTEASFGATFAVTLKQVQ